LLNAADIGLVTSQQIGAPYRDSPSDERVYPVPTFKDGADTVSCQSSAFLIGSDWGTDGCGATNTGRQPIADFHQSGSFHVSVPEPSSIALALSGLAGLGFLRRRRSSGAA
jgi:hypothetical protein